MDSEYFSDEASDDIVDIVEGSGKNDTVDDNDEYLLAPADPNEGIEENSDADDYKSKSDEESQHDKDDEHDFEFVDYKTAYSKEIFIVDPDDRRTTHIMSKFEMTEYVSIRAEQISRYNNCMTPSDGIDDPIKKAKLELMRRKCILTLRRYVGDRRDKKTGEVKSYYEDWDPSEMVFATTYQID